MYKLKISVTKVLGECSSTPPSKPGDTFTVIDGDIRIPEGGFICLWALQSILPLITPKEREISENQDDDWMWRVHHVQCPDPDGRVIYRIERVGIVEKNVGECEEAQVPLKVNAIQDIQEADSISDGLRNLRVIVEEVRGKCTSGMQVGDHFILRSGRLYIPPDRHFCLYALHAALPLLPAKQRPLPEDDWLNRDNHIICPDPAGNVVLRIEAYP